MSATLSRFEEKLVAHQQALKPLSLDTLQLNITKLCNQACQHCHVDASPKRTEMMSEALLDKAVALCQAYPELKHVDITGGAPELHPQFKSFVQRLRALDKHVMVRHNLTVTLDPHPQTGASMADLPDFFAEQQVEIFCSLPYYQAFFTDKQRGKGVFEKSIESLQRLNKVGYGQDPALVLNLVYNPVGAFLPADQASLEADYKKALHKDFGIVFNHLFTITNIPIQRFRRSLELQGNYDTYMNKLISAFNPQAAEGVMCRSLLSVGYDGSLYDCDFNQMLETPVRGPVQNLMDFEPEALLAREIVFADHCFGCTAGAGSSCTGATS